MKLCNFRYTYAHFNVGIIFVSFFILENKSNTTIIRYGAGAWGMEAGWDMETKSHTLHLNTYRYSYCIAIGCFLC